MYPKHSSLTSDVQWARQIRNDGGWWRWTGKAINSNNGLVISSAILAVDILVMHPSGGSWRDNLEPPSRIFWNISCHAACHKMSRALAVTVIYCRPVQCTVDTSKVEPYREELISICRKRKAPTSLDDKGENCRLIHPGAATHSAGVVRYQRVSRGACRQEKTRGEKEQQEALLSSVEEEPEDRWKQNFRRVWPSLPPASGCMRAVHW